MGMVCEFSSGGAETGVGGRVGKSEPRPLPSALRGFSVLFMVQDLFSELDVTLSALRPGIIRQDGLSEAWCFSQANTPRNDCFENVIAEELFQIRGNLAG